MADINPKLEIPPPKELEMTMARDKEDILLKRQVEAVLLEREKDLDEEIERSLCDYDG